MAEIVIPGEKLSDGTNVGHGVFKRDGHVYSKVYGLLNKREGVPSVVPLHGRYMPREGDLVIGIIEASRFRMSFVEINSPYNGRLCTYEDDDFKPGDLLLVKIAEVNEVYKMELVDARKLYDGKLIEIPAVKIPRVVGKKGSMLNVLRSGTNCTIFVGRNGRIFIKGTMENIAKAETAIKMIEEQAHTPGLTEKISAFLGTKPETRIEEVRHRKPAEHKLGKFETALEIFDDKTEENNANENEKE